MEDASMLRKGVGDSKAQQQVELDVEIQHEVFQNDLRKTVTDVTLELVRPLFDWEISRDHLVFADMFGRDTCKRHILHVLEPRKEGVHGGILLTAVGNTVQILNMSLQVATSDSSVQTRRYLFGFSGSGIGCLAVHPSRQFFAVGEKGEKPNITIYRYPQITVSHVLRNGTERAYASVEFSTDGDKLASLGNSPDYLLTVWNWRREHILLRCKAFGQDVFTVRFAPTDSGFLATSGVGHIRFWKMAATFTGLKLQGDIGKFGKSELSDIEAFCVLPDKKVLSGTERGVLLLWDGNFIKCEILTSRRHLPHAGTINVVDFDEDEGHIVTAGEDGYVRFWDFNSIDSADVAADETVALVPIKRQMLVRPHMDIRAVVKEASDRYLLQDSDGSVHLLLLYSNDEHDVEMNYISNDTGRATGIACSPYEHLAVTCGEDGSVRAWDYTSEPGRCIMVVFPERFNDYGHTSVAASTIAWVPNSAAILNDVLPVSRQVVVGFDDGLVRVLLMDVDNYAWVLVNVFKPHSKRVTCVTFSHSGSAFATASTDGTIFLFRVVQSSKLTEIDKSKPEYDPYGFQCVPAPVVAMCWRDDDAAILATLANGQVLEYFLPDDLNRNINDDQGYREKNKSTHATDENVPQRKSSPDERESFEVHFISREWTLRRRNRFMSVKELDILEGQNSRMSSLDMKDEARDNFYVEVKAAKNTAKQLAALYEVVPTDDTSSPLRHDAKDCIYLSCEAPLDGSLFVVQYDQPLPLKEFASESAGQITSLALSSSNRFILCGLSNGKFQIRSSQRPHAYISGEFHDYAASTSNNKQHLTLSFDDAYVLAVGRDGNLSICRLHSEKVEEASKQLAFKFECMLADAASARDHAHEMQKTAVETQQNSIDNKNYDDSGDSGRVANTALSALPAFYGAKAYAAFIENLLSPSVAAAKDSEQFRGVVRLTSDVFGTDDIRKAMPIVYDESSNVKSGVPATALLQFRVNDVANPKDAYTIEDVKLKSEADARAKSALSKQDSTRYVVNKLRKQFVELQAQDAALPLHSRIDADEWEIDLNYGDLLRRQGDEACDEVRKALALAVDTEKLLLSKMREAYLGPLAVEVLTLHAFESGLSVQSFRTMNLSASLHKSLAEIHAVDESSKKQSFVRLDDPSKRASVLRILEKNAHLEDDFPLKEDERRSLTIREHPAVDGKKEEAGLASGPITMHESDGSKSVHGFEARKRLRTERKMKLSRWQSSKPSDDADDPRDVVAIAFAQRNMGDYKLKTAADYVVPEHQRVNAVKKLRQMALLEEDLFSSRLRFNAKVLELRDLKVQLIDVLHRDQEQRSKLLSMLVAKDSNRAKTSSALLSKDFNVDLREWPEKRDHVTDSDIDLYLREKKVRSHVQSNFNDGNKSMSRSGAEKHFQISDRSIAAVARAVKDTSFSSGTAQVIMIGHLCLQIDEGYTLATTSTAATTSPLTKAQSSGSISGHYDDDNGIREYMIRQEIMLLERKQQRNITAFDAAIANLRREKLDLEVGFKQAELRLLTYQSELSLLESFESKENVLSSKLEKSKGEKTHNLAEMRDVNDLLMSKKQNLDDWSRHEKALQAEFLTLVNAGSTSSPHPCFAILQKIYKRKIKRAKRKLNNSSKEDGKKSESATNNEEQDEADEDEEEEDDDYDEDDDDDSEEEDDNCPPGCELTLYEKVLTLREKRADVDDAMTELNKSIDELRKTGERLTAKQRAIDKELAVVEQDTQQFQSEKQSRFNQLDVVVPLSTRQLRCLEFSSSIPSNWILPSEATHCLVFTTSAFSALTERIESVQSENKQLRQKFRDLHKQQNVLAREKRRQNEAIARARERSEQLMRLKFGQLVDLEVLDRVCDASMVDNLQTRVKMREIECERAMRRIKQTHPKLQHKILLATEQNTALLTQIAALTARQAELERELNSADNDSRNGGMHEFDDDQALVEREMMERNKLVRLVKLQAREVEALKQEIGLLRGKVYAPR
ncbi:putative WD40/YVTN repeat-like-containing domain superfamily, WD40-repeat-containing [Plasmopara halstedii]